MNTNDLHTRSLRRIAERSDRNATQSRWPALMFLGVPVAIVGAVVAVASLGDNTMAMVVGVALLAGGAAFAAASAWNLPGEPAVDRRRADRTAGQDGAQEAWTPWSIQETFDSAHLGAEPEQEMGRRTGART
jgi:hypothetical protein